MSQLRSPAEVAEKWKLSAGIMIWDWVMRKLLDDCTDIPTLSRDCPSRDSSFGKHLPEAISGQNSQGEGMLSVRQVQKQDLNHKKAQNLSHFSPRLSLVGDLQPNTHQRDWPSKEEQQETLTIYKAGGENGFTSVLFLTGDSELLRGRCLRGTGKPKQTKK